MAPNQVSVMDFVFCIIAKGKGYIFDFRGLRVRVEHFHDNNFPI